jgi:hypothetical protein
MQARHLRSTWRGARRREEVVVEREEMEEKEEKMEEEMVYIPKGELLRFQEVDGGRDGPRTACTSAGQAAAGYVTGRREEEEEEFFNGRAEKDEG